MAIGCASASNAVPGVVTSSSRATGGSAGAGAFIAYQTAAAARPPQSSAALQGTSVQSEVAGTFSGKVPATFGSADVGEAEIERKWADPGLTPTSASGAGV